KGTILFRHPSPRTWIGQTFPNEELLKTFWSSHEGMVEAENSTGVPTFYVFATGQNQLARNQTVAAEEKVCVLSVPQDVLFAAANRTLYTSLAWLGVASGLAVILGWIFSDLLIVRPVRALVQSSARLAAGDLSARTGLRYGRDELGRLMLAFDQMA